MNGEQQDDLEDIILYYNDCVYFYIYIDFQQLNYGDDFKNGQLQYYNEGCIF